jgi:hypothetical protein
MPQTTGQAKATASADTSLVQRVRIQGIRVSVGCLLAALVGCASIPLSDQTPDVAGQEGQEEPSPAPKVVAEPTPLPTPVRRDVAAPEPFSPKATIVVSDRSAAFESVATELQNRLDGPLVYNLADSESHAEAFAGIAESGATIVIAIGLPATRAAAQWSTVPVIYCQVFNFAAADPARVPVKGVASMPPLAVQLDAWTQHNPGLRSVGAILGEGHQGLIAEAVQATAAQGLKFHYRTASSDRETLYLFNRIAPDIDGFWLFPDNRILSVPVLKKVVAIAARHQVQIAVFNDALLDLGVSLSTAAVESDIATTVLAVAAKLAAGDSATVPSLTPLHEVRTRTAFPSVGGTSPVATGQAAANGLSGGRP